MSRRSATDHQYQLQLLADKSVVLVGATGYESEIFIPKVHQGRIMLMNVIFRRQVNMPGMQSPRPINRKITTATAGLAPTTVGQASFSSNPAGSNTMTDCKQRFELKLISNGNVVLAERNGLESEIFLPYIFSRCLSMKRVSAHELTQFASRRSKKTMENQDQSENMAAMAASLAAQAMGLSKMLVNPLQQMNTENNVNKTLASGSNRKRKAIKQPRKKEAGDQ